MKSLLNRCRLVSEQLCIFGPKVLLQASPKQFSIVPVHRLNIYFVFMNDFTLLVWRQVFFPICKLMNSVLSRENSILSVQLIILLLIAVMQSGWYGSSFQPSYQNFQTENLVGCWDDGSVFQQAHNCLNSSGTAMNDLPMNDFTVRWNCIRISCWWDIPAHLQLTILAIIGNHSNKFTFHCHNHCTIIREFPHLAWIAQQSRSL